MGMEDFTQSVVTRLSAFLEAHELRVERTAAEMHAYNLMKEAGILINELIDRVDELEGQKRVFEHMWKNRA